MVWLALISAVLKAMNTGLGYLQQKQTLDAGAAEAIAAHLQGALDEIDKATAARDAVRAADPARLRDADPDSRD